MFIAAEGLVILYLLSSAIRKPIDHNKGNDEIYFSTFEIREGNFLITSITGKFNLMAFKITDSQQISGVLTFKDKKLKVTDVPDGAVTVQSTDENVFTVGYEDATNTITAKGVGPGVAALKITAKNASGNDIPFEDIAGEVTSGDAATGGVEFGEPSEQPE